MFRFEALLRFPRLYAAFALRTKNPNFEKILYLREVKPGYTVFDLGANIGYYTYLFSRLVGKKGEVIAFEPVPDTFQALFRNTEKCSNLKLHNFAVGNSRKEGNVFYDPEDLGKSNLLSKATNSVRVAKTQIVPLDEYCKANNLGRLDFVKCDIEGYELHAMKGMRETLGKFLPKISIEVTLPDKERLALIELLREIGYDVFRKIECGYPLVSTDEDLCSDDFVYLHALSSKFSPSSS